MNANTALKLAAPRAVGRPVLRMAPARKPVRAQIRPALRPIVQPAGRGPELAPSAGARIETVLMGITFLALACLAISMEAVGVAASLL